MSNGEATGLPSSHKLLVDVEDAGRDVLAVLDVDRRTAESNPTARELIDRTPARLGRSPSARRKDATGRKGMGLASYYTEEGDVPGRWLGAGLAGIDGIDEGGVVTADHMKALFGVGMHPLAIERNREFDARPLGQGSTAKERPAATRLGIPFKVYSSEPSAFTAASSGRKQALGVVVSELLRLPRARPSFYLTSKPQPRTVPPTLEDRLWHIRIAPLIEIHGVRLRQAQDLSDVMRIDEVVDIHGSAHKGDPMRLRWADASPVGGLKTWSSLPNILGMDPFDSSGAAQQVRAHWESRQTAGEMTPGTARRYERVFSAFCRFAAAHGTDVGDVDRHICEAFVRAPRPNGQPPAAATSRFRLTVVRDAYLALTGAIEDPTHDLRVHQVPQSRKVVPLTPAEAARLRSSARTSPRDQLRPAAVELALLGASHLEVARVVVADLDLAAESALLGSRRIEMDHTATSVLQARVAACRRTARRRGAGWEPDRVAVALSRPLDTYPETSIAPGISSSLSRALAKAGLSRLGVRASSIREYAANRAYALTRRAEDVALVLGLESLDAAMGYVDLAWQHRYGDEVRG